MALSPIIKCNKNWISYWINEMSMVQFIIIVLPFEQQKKKREGVIEEWKRRKKTIDRFEKKMDRPINGRRNMIENLFVFGVSKKITNPIKMVFDVCTLRAIDLIWMYSDFLMAIGHSYRSVLGKKWKYLIQVSHRKSWIKTKRKEKKYDIKTPNVSLHTCVSHFHRWLQQYVTVHAIKTNNHKFFGIV